MRAMILDDEPLSLAGMERMLRRYEVDVCGAFLDPAEAVARAAELGADVAFVDIEMPGMSGLVAAERLTAALPELQIVFVTAYDQYAVNAFELNATDYLLKPVQAKRLESTLERLAARAARRPEAARPSLGRPTFRCFLRLAVAAEGGGDLDIPWRTSKAKEVFAYLLHMRNRPVSKDVLIDLMWPELDMGKAQTHLHTTVYQIRQTLKGMALPVKLSFADGGYRLELNGATVDADVWERQLAAEPGGNALTWMELYRGDYFEQEGYLWAEQERERLRVRWLENALRIARERGERSWDSTVHALLEEAVARFPSVQESYALLMRMYHAQGRAQEIRKTFARLRESLLEESGEEPAADIASWYEANYEKG